MDRLLTIDPKQLLFDIDIERCISFFALKNVMFTMPVAFKIKCSSPKRYAVKPAQGIIPPSGRVTVEVVLNPQSCHPEEFLNSTDRFIVKSLVVPGGNQYGSVSNDWFESKKNFVYVDTSLRVVFKGLPIVQSLIAKGSMEDVRETLELGVDLKRLRSDESDQSPFHVAIANGRPEMVQLLLEFGADVDVRDRSGKTPLHEAAASGQSLITELLLANRANVESRTTSVGWTALHFAANGRHSDTVQILLSKGADANSVAGPESRTALHMATATGSQQCMKLLLGNGASVDAVTSAGLTALHIAASQADMAAVKLLIDHGANRNVRDLEGHIPFDLAVEAGGDTELLDILKLGEDLRRAARKGDVRSVRVCLKQGAAVNGRDQNGWTALHCAAFKGHADVVRVLLEKNADVNLADSEGYSALHCAVEMGHSDVIRMLLKRGADVNLKINTGFSSVQIGSLMGEDCIVELLMDAGARDSSLTSEVKKVITEDDLLRTKGINSGKFGPRRQTLAC